MDRKMLAPLVIPMAENMSTFTNFAERANQVSENKCHTCCAGQVPFAKAISEKGVGIAFLKLALEAKNR